MVPDISSRFFSIIASTIEEQLKQKGYNLLLYSFNKDQEREIEYLNHIIFEKTPEGIIFAPFAINAAKFQKVIKTNKTNAGITTDMLE